MTGFYPGRPPIDAYGNGGFRFAGISHKGSILVLPSGIYAWSDHDDFSAVMAERGNIDLLVIGTGRTMLRRAVPGILADVMTTGAAVSTYNLLLAENRKVAAALVAVE